MSLWIYSRLFLQARSQSDKRLVFIYAVEWVEATLGITLDGELTDHAFAILCSPQGEAFLRWTTGSDVTPKT